MTAPSSQRYAYAIVADHSKRASTLEAHQDASKAVLGNLDALRIMRAKAWMARRPDVEFVPNALAKIDPWKTDGEPIDPSHIPRNFFFRKSLPKTLPHFSWVRISVISSATIVSRQWKTAIERTEHGRHEFHEVECICLDGRSIPPHYLSREQVKIAAIDPERSSFKKAMVREGITVWRPSPGHTYDIADSLVISATAVKDRHYWIDSMLNVHFMSGEMLSEIGPLVPKWLKAVRHPIF